MNSSDKKKFWQWASAAPAVRVEAFRIAILAFQRFLEDHHFRQCDKSFDIGPLPANSVNFERGTVSGRIDYVILIFDTRYKPRFQVLFGSKGSDRPHVWIRSGALVSKKSELLKHKWWGATVWSLNKDKSLINAIQTVEKLLPQVIEFLDNGGVGSNVWEVILQDS